MILLPVFNCSCIAILEIIITEFIIAMFFTIFALIFHYLNSVVLHLYVEIQKS